MKCLVILFNIGGPEDETRTFSYLRRFFYDKRILTLNFVFRFFLAIVIAFFRAKKSSKKYRKIGGSPSEKNSMEQAIAIEKELISQVDYDLKVATCMRYSKSSEANLLRLINYFKPNKIIALPLFPQFSSATTMSAFDQLEKIQKKAKFLEVQKICCFYNDVGLIEFYSKKINEKIKSLNDAKNIQILFSAHGLPKSFIDNGDPYEDHVEFMAKEIAKCANIKDWLICYQSRVGLQEWLAPSTKEAIELASKNKKGVILVPISFVSENLETLYDMDIEIKSFAESCGIKFFSRIDTPNTDNIFLKSISEKILTLINSEEKFLGCKRNCSIKCGYIK